MLKNLTPPNLGGPSHPKVTLSPKLRNRFFRKEILKGESGCVDSCAQNVPPVFPPGRGGTSEFVEREEDDDIWTDESDGVQQGRRRGPLDGSDPVAGRTLLPDHHVRGHLRLQQEQQVDRDPGNPALPRCLRRHNLLGKGDGRQSGSIR